MVQVGYIICLTLTAIGLIFYSVSLASSSWLDVKVNGTELSKHVALPPRINKTTGQFEALPDIFFNRSYSMIEECVSAPEDLLEEANEDEPPYLEFVCFVAYPTRPLTVTKLFGDWLAPTGGHRVLTPMEKAQTEQHSQPYRTATTRIAGLVLYSISMVTSFAAMICFVLILLKNHTLMMPKIAGVFIIVSIVSMFIGMICWHVVAGTYAATNYFMAARGIQLSPTNGTSTTDAMEAGALGYFTTTFNGWSIIVIWVGVAIHIVAAGLTGVGIAKRNLTTDQFKTDNAHLSFD